MTKLVVPDNSLPWADPVASMYSSDYAKAMIVKYTIYHGRLTISEDGKWHVLVNSRSHGLQAAEQNPNGMEIYLQSICQAIELALKPKLTRSVSQGQFDTLIDYFYSTNTHKLHTSPVIWKINCGFAARALEYMIADHVTRHGSTPAARAHRKAWQLVWRLPDAETDETPVKMLARL